MNLNFLEPFKAIFLVLLLLELSTLGVTNSANISCIEKEKQALLEFKHGLVDEAGLLSSWGFGDCCHWSGVECSPETGNVEKLDIHADFLRGQHLKGEISPSLIDMQHLKYLDLSYNDFNWKEIPLFFGSLNNLEYHNLSHAYFGGIIACRLGNLSNLQVLDLSANSFVGMIPYQLGNLSDLLELRLRENDLVGVVPCQLANLSSLQILHLRDNDGLRIDENNGVVAQWVFNLPYLTDLNLRSFSNLNKSKSSLQAIAKLPNLRRLSLANCSLTDDKVLHLNYSSSLGNLDLGLNNFTSSIFPWLLNFTSNLVELYLNHNNLSGPIHGDFGKSMKNMEVLDLSNNRLNGTVSDIHFDNLTN